MDKNKIIIAVLLFLAVASVSIMLLMTYSDKKIIERMEKENYERAFGSSLIVKEDTSEQQSSSVADDEEVSKPIPDYVQKIFEQLKSALDKNNSAITISTPEVSESKGQDYEYRSCSVELSDSSGNKGKLSFLIKNIETNEPYKSMDFQVFYKQDMPSTFIKDTIQSIISAVNPTGSTEEAAAYLDKIKNSFSLYSASDVIEVNNYFIYLESSSPSSPLNYITLELRHKDELHYIELPENFNSSDFKEYSIDELKSPLNEAAAVHIEGSIIGRTQSVDFESYYIDVLDLNGQKYHLYYDLSYLPISLEEGQYDIYGYFHKFDGSFPVLFLKYIIKK